MNKLFKIISYTFITTLLLAVAALFVLPLLPFENNIQIKIVKSGSMEPSIHTGSIVVIRPSDSLQVGDVITFGKDTPNSFPTTHRIISVTDGNGVMMYETKGDANEEVDPVFVSSSEVIGKVVLTVPKAGYILDFTKKPLGFILIIALPAALVILNELVDIFAEIRKGIKKRREGKNTYFKRFNKTEDVLRPVYTSDVTPREERNDKTIITALVFVIMSGFIFIDLGETKSYFKDVETSVSNVVSAMTFEINALSTPNDLQVSASPVVTITNEVTPNPEGLPNEYVVSVEKTSGVDALCDALIMNSTSTPPFAYSGSLLNFVSPPTVYSGSWWFDVNIDPQAVGIHNEDTCVIDLVYTANAWLEDKGVHGGYSDTERVSITFRAQVEALEVLPLQVQSLFLIEETLEEEPESPPAGGLPEQANVPEDPGSNGGGGGSNSNSNLPQEEPVVEETSTTTEPVIEEVPATTTPEVIETPPVEEVPEPAPEPVVEEEVVVEETVPVIVETEPQP